MLLFDEDAGGTGAWEALPGSGEPAGAERTVMVDTGMRDAEEMVSAIRLRRLKELPTSLPVGGIITPV